MSQGQTQQPMNIPSREEFAEATCFECGAVGCRVVLIPKDPDATSPPVFCCAKCEPTAAREGRNRQLVENIENAFGESMVTYAEALSILSILMLKIGFEAGESIDSLQQGLVEAQPVLAKLYTDESPEAGALPPHG